MAKLADTSEYYSLGNRAVVEEINWIIAGKKRTLEFLLPKLGPNHVNSVIEWGCGSGILVPEVMKEVERYIGVDGNEKFLSFARRRNRGNGAIFMRGDVRTLTFDKPNSTKHDLSMAWSFLKNFSLDEWDDILRKILNAGSTFACFDMQHFDKDLDLGTDYHHVYVTADRLKRVVADADHEIMDSCVFWEGTLEGYGPMKEMAYWTRRKTCQPDLSLTVNQ